MNPKPVTLSPGCKARPYPVMHTAFTEQSIKWHFQSFYVDQLNCMWLWQLNIYTLTYCSVIKLQALACTRFLLLFLHNFLLCGMERFLILGFVMWYKHSVPVWCNLHVRQWRDCPVKEGPPTVLDHSDCTVGAERHLYTTAVLLLIPRHPLIAGIS